ncbi:MAG: hypothetical protein PHY12_06865, partial [Eubacteriales bacterium]|nr:hypothetical protein [Eubacteriales bacterium]
YAKGKRTGGKVIAVKDGNGVRGAVPQKIHLPAEGETPEPLQIMFRPSGVFENAYLRILDGETEIYKAKKRIMTPGEMAEVVLKPEVLQKLSGSDLNVRIDA